jgi:hypothetical protein
VLFVSMGMMSSSRTYHQPIAVLGKAHQSSQD